jgi:gluconolactonase
MMRQLPALLAIAAAFACPAAASAAEPGTAPGAPSAACGKAPAGEMVAQRVEAVKPSRKEAGLYEGPVWVKDALYFSDFAFSQGFPSRIRKLSADGSVSTVTEDGGSNGLAVDANGDLVVASHKDKALLRQSLKDGKRTPIAQRYDGQVFNSPNDIAIAADGTIYFTDPDYQKAAAPGGQPVTGIYRVGTDGKVTLIDGTRHNPNGVALSLKEDVLYVNASDNEVRAYPLAGADRLHGRTFARIDGGDGMTLDCHGNLYVTEHGAKRVRVFSPLGKELATIRVDANVTNVAFGGMDGRTLFITGASAVWRIGLDVTGRPY